jgi:hypothetical protein
MNPSDSGSILAQASLNQTSLNQPSLAQAPQKREVIADRGDHGAMPQQHNAGSHGHEMHPQKFVQLVGCRDPNAVKGPAADRLH